MSSIKEVQAGRSRPLLVAWFEAERKKIKYSDEKKMKKKKMSRKEEKRKEHEKKR